MSLSKKWKTSGAPNKPYFLPFQQCVVDATQIIESERLVHFVFDQQNEFEESAKSLFALMKGQHRDISERLGDIVYTSKKRAIMLQVADFVAYEIFQMLVGNRPKADRSMSMQHPIFQPSTLLTTIDSVALARMLKEQPVTPDKHFVWPRRSLARIGGFGWKNQNSSILMT